VTEALKAVVLEDRRIVAIDGPDRVKFLQGLMTNDMRRLAPALACYAGLLSGQGKLLQDCFVVDDGSGRILVDLAAIHVKDFVDRLTTFKLRAAVELTEPEPAFAVAVAWGPEAAARLGLDPTEGAAGKGVPASAHYAYVDPRVAALGVRLIYPAGAPIEAELGQLGFAVTAPGEYALRRLALGVADSAEMGGGLYPLEANFEALHGVDFKKGCYVGQELTARMKLKGELRKRILPVVGTAPLPDAGTRVMAEGAELGSLIAASGTQGLALLRLDRLADAKEDAIRALEVPLTIQWPDWLPH
jgi:folate-binding protein YgfZ